MLGIRRSQGGCRQVGAVSAQQSAFSNQRSAKPVYRKGRERTQRKKKIPRFLFSFASVAIKLLLIADG